jgi:hypothetical protein
MDISIVDKVGEHRIWISFTPSSSRRLGRMYGPHGPVIHVERGQIHFYPNRVYNLLNRIGRGWTTTSDQGELVVVSLVMPLPSSPFQRPAGFEGGI